MNRKIEPSEAFYSIIIFAFLIMAAGMGCESTSKKAIKDQLSACYQAVADAFAAGDAQALASVYTPDISQPMNYEKILQWGKTFFEKHPGTRLLVENLSFDQVAANAATVTLTYRVTTTDHDGEFSGIERDFFEKRGGRWLIRSWQKVEPPSK